MATDRKATPEALSLAQTFRGPAAVTECDERSLAPPEVWLEAWLLDSVLTPPKPVQSDRRMNFYASQVFLETLARVHFPNKSWNIRDFEVEGKVFRLLELGKRRVVTHSCFYDYVEPLKAEEWRSPERRSLFLPFAAQQPVPIEGWSEALVEGFRPSPYVDFSGFGTYEEYRKMVYARGSRFKKNRRLRDRLEEDFGSLEFAVHEPEKEVFELSYAWKSEQLRATGLEDVYSDPKNRAFLQALLAQGALRCSTLRARGRLIATWLGFVHEGYWSGWVFAHDPDPALKKYSVGYQLIESLLEECFRAGLRGFDFSVGSSDYKFAYATHVRAIGPLGKRPLVQELELRMKKRVKPWLESRPEVLERARELRDLGRVTLRRLGGFF